MIIGAVCARAGSKGLPGKNVRKLDGIPLIERAINTGIDSMCERIVVSTDIPEYASMPSINTVRYLERPAHLAGDQVSKWPVYQHILEWAQMEWADKPFDAVVDIDVSRPLVTGADVDKCLRAWWRNSYADTVMAVSRARKSPYFDIVEVDLEGRVSLSKQSVPPFTCRQDLPPTYYHAGIYVVSADALRADTGMWEGKVYAEEVSDIAAWDIDDETDFMIAEMLIQQRVTI